MSKIRARMVWHRELRWLLAAKLLGWSFDLVQREASVPTLLAFRDLFGGMDADPKFKTVTLRRPYDDPRCQ